MKNIIYNIFTLPISILVGIMLFIFIWSEYGGEYLKTVSKEDLDSQTNELIERFNLASFCEVLSVWFWIIVLITVWIR